ncbi:uncharacterized protein LOC109418019 [Aedes albopictus]|uniref:Secreted protein n=1 Tax=Aedes albopictus TaxID=7160 RepID=A0ABM1Y279_AEDAL
MNQACLITMVLMNLVLIWQSTATPINSQTNGAVAQQRQVAEAFDSVIPIPKNIVKREFLPPPLFEVEYIERIRGEEEKSRKEQNVDKDTYIDAERNDHSDDNDDEDLVLLG